VSGGADAERGIVRAGRAAADAAAPTRDTVLAATRLVRDGRMFRLARERFPKMPLFPGHPAFEVLAYRTPQGIRNAGDEPWGPPNDACLGYMSELVMGTTHTGAHIDAHAHMTVGDEQRWHGGSARTDLGDFGPLIGDATEIPPLWRRGVLYDVPGHRGVDALPAAEPVPAEELLAIEAAVTSRRGPIPSGSRRTAAPGRTSRPRGCSSSAASSRRARTRRPTRSNPPRTAASRRIPSPCTPSC
jgi:hypothetical protein